MRILVDMDEVLCDFTGGALAVHGVTREELEAKREPGEWDITIPLGGMTQEEFWRPINAVGEAFWIGLQPLPWFGDLVQWMTDVAGDEWYVVTAPPWDPAACSGKVRWLKQRFGRDFTRFVITGHKHLLADGPGTILIDDRERTVEQFCLNGGNGILFPSNGNTWYSWAYNPVQYVKELWDAFTVQKCEHGISGARL